jgi:hypothetical protein
MEPPIGTTIGTRRRSLATNVAQLKPIDNRDPPSSFYPIHDHGRIRSKGRPSTHGVEGLG